MRTLHIILVTGVSFRITMWIQQLGKSMNFKLPWNSEALFTNALHTVSANDSNGIKNDMYANWNTFKTGVAALLYRNSAEAWIGLINKYDNAKGSVLLINSWGSIKVYRHYGTVLTDIYAASWNRNLTVKILPIFRVKMLPDLLFSPLSYFYVQQKSRHFCRLKKLLLSSSMLRIYDTTLSRYPAWYCSKLMWSLSLCVPSAPWPPRSA